ncbi:autotransporter domain-containing protein [Hyphomicrobium facile]|uniref:Outer membrane autotransporter barrel domain-containing protein n=1 Tax=Hyphomicrobium facile TaxID=51670 RepID=A0A1I7MUP5_9HYPH|nr:autotransporter domain-containing protein [Hyphomicrobium facile]SFV26118.1 outer membrane autotransporter barrel domain-containing protein [Hyphomicrobium facile]
MYFLFFLESIEANYGGDTGQIFGEMGLPMNAGSLAFEPFAGIAYVHVSTDRFSEEGGVATLGTALSHLRKSAHDRVARRWRRP